MQPYRILVIANDTGYDNSVLDLLAGHAGSRMAEVLVVAPALAGRLDYWAGDDRRARHAAEERLDRLLDALGCRGFAATGWVGDANPLLAIADALTLFAADEIVVATSAARHPNWLTRNVVGRARERFDQPVHGLAA
jgi:hypothetical protein